MTIEITRAPEPPASDPPDVLQQDGVQTQDQASDTTVLITEAEVALGTAAATGVRRKDRRWVALLSRIFVPAPKASLPKRRPYQPRMAYLDYALMARDGATVSPFSWLRWRPTLALATAGARPDTAPVSRREKGPTMLNATLGMLAMLPVVFGVAGYAMVSR